jgi:hypothetical protein
VSGVRKRVRNPSNAFRFRRKIRIGLNKRAYAVLQRLSVGAQRSREDIIRAAIRDYLANQTPYEGCVVNEKRPHVAYVKLSDDAADHFADTAFAHKSCHGYGRFIGSIVERYFTRFRYQDLVKVFAAYADILVPIRRRRNG